MMMSNNNPDHRLTIRDNTGYQPAVFDEVPDLFNHVANKTLKQLELEGIFIYPPHVAEAEDLTDEQMILKSVGTQYYTSNAIGYLGSGTERLTIASRFYTGLQDHFFKYLLRQVFDIPNIVNLDQSGDHDQQMFDLLLFMFPDCLKTALRKGPYKTYIRHQYNDANVKGTIDIARHIHVDTPFVGNIAYSQREFSFDNQVMELIRHTIEFIKQKPFGRQLLHSVKDEVASVVAATPEYAYYERGKVLINNKKRPVRHAFYAEYRALQRLCVMILQHDKQEIGTGVKQIHGVLFDAAWLWEEYVNQLIEIDFYHPQNKGHNGAQRLFSNPDDRNVGLIYPDFIGCHADHRVIADTKYKPVNNIAQHDYMQILTYMFRFDAKLAYFLYPEKDDLPGLPLYLNRGNTYEGNVTSRADICVTKLGLKIPHVPDNTKDAFTYDDFVGCMQQAEQEFVAELKQAVE